MEIQDEEYESNLLRQPQGYSIPKCKVLLAIMLFITGITSLIVGGVAEIKGKDTALPLFIIGGVTIIPGAYYTYLIVQAARGIQGYTWRIFPEFD